LRRHARDRLSSIGAVARSIARAERVAADPDELVGLARVGDPVVGIVAEAEGGAAGAIGPHERRTVLASGVEADVVAPDAPPRSFLVELIAQRPRLMRIGERVLRGEAEITDAAALGDEHDLALAAFGKRDIAHRLAHPGALDVLRLHEEVRQDEFA